MVKAKIHILFKDGDRDLNGFCSMVSGMADTVTGFKNRYKTEYTADFSLRYRYCDVTD